MKGYKPQQFPSCFNSKFQTASKKASLFLELGELEEGGEDEIEKGKYKIKSSNIGVKRGNK
jgi:hypothetical protein